MDQQESIEDALDAQKRWLSIAALEPNAEYRRQALARAHENRQRAIELFASQGIDTTEQLLAATAVAEDFDASMKQIRSPRAGTDPKEIASLSARVMELAVGRSYTWRKHPIRRANVERQRIQIAMGEWMLETFPFLRPPAEWMVRKLNPIAERLGL